MRVRARMPAFSREMESGKERGPLEGVAFDEKNEQRGGKVRAKNLTVKSREREIEHRTMVFERTMNRREQ